MAAPRDLVSSMKIETFFNVSIISKLHPLPSDLRQLFNRDAMEKLTQNVFNPLSYYLVSIVDPGKASAFSWPLYDTTERAYRNELSSFIADYSGKGLLSPVMSSYLVNPACYKVTLFMFQLSQLAVQCTLESVMKREHQKKLYTEITEKYKSQNELFVEEIEKQNQLVYRKLSNYIEKRKKYEKIAELFRNGITSMEGKLTKLKPKEKVATLVDSFEMDNTIDEALKISILEIKNFNKPAQYFNQWLEDIDSDLDDLEKEWNCKMSPIVNSASKTMKLTKELIERQTGEADKNSFVVEYNLNDEICMKDLYETVNSQQKYILKNIVKNNRLSFPNLIRGYIVAVSYIFKNKQLGDEIYRINEYLQHSNKSYSEMVEAMKAVMERLSNAEARLDPSPLSFDQAISIKDLIEIPPLPDLSSLSMNRDIQTNVSFTPLGANRQINLRRTNITSFAKPQNRSLMYSAPRDDSLKNFISGTYDKSSMSTVHNLSIISQVHGRSNETIADCAYGFTKQQKERLLSTNKRFSITKKHKCKLDRPTMLIKKGGLFNVSNSSKAAFNVSNTSSENGLFRCHSSPNLCENKDNKYIRRGRNLSIIQEGSPSLQEVSGIMALQKDMPEHAHKESIMDFEQHTPEHAHIQMPVLIESPSFPANAKIIDHLSKDIGNNSVESGIASTCLKKSIDNAIETPKSKIPVPIKQTSSIEKIINRFKKVKANLIAQEQKGIEIKTIVEEKENCNTVNVDVFTANKVLLSPSYNVISMNTSDFLEQIGDDDETTERRPRESLRTALGVDVSNTSSENGLFRCHSSPNLCENRENKYIRRGRKFSSMQEGSPSLQEVSGIMALQKDMPEHAHKESIKDFEQHTPEHAHIQMPVLIESPSFPANAKIMDHLSKDIANNSVESGIASMVKGIEIKTIVEEKENFNAVNVDVFTENKVLLPDLLSPSYSALSMNTSDFLEQIGDDVETTERRPRESLGTVLGVDNTFLDQFDLID